MSTIVFQPLGLADLDPITARAEASLPRLRALWHNFGENPALAGLPGLSAGIEASLSGFVAPKANTAEGYLPMPEATMLPPVQAAASANLPRYAAFVSDMGSVLRGTLPPMFPSASARDPEAGSAWSPYDESLYAFVWAAPDGGGGGGGGNRINIALADALLLADLPVLARSIVILRDTLRLYGHAHPVMSLALAMDDALALHDTLRAALVIVLREALALRDAGVSTRTVLHRLIDTLLLEQFVSSVYEAQVTLASLLLMDDALDAKRVQLLRDALGLGDLVGVDFTAVMRLVERLALRDQADRTLILAVHFEDRLPLSDALAARLTAQAILNDALDLYGYLTINGGAWACWTINTESKGVARFDHYPFNSFAQFPDGRWAGATDIGLHEIGGDTDAGEPITARIRSALTDFGDRRMKRAPNLYIGYTASGQIGLKVLHTSEQGSRIEDHYLLEPRNAPDVRESRYKIGRGINSVYLGFELVNVDGAYFELDVVEWRPMRTSRRVR